MIDPFGWIEEESRKRLNLGMKSTMRISLPLSSARIVSRMAELRI